jgi:hypothetical protein
MSLLFVYLVVLGFYGRRREGGWREEGGRMEGGREWRKQ